MKTSQEIAETEGRIAIRTHGKRGRVRFHLLKGLDGVTVCGRLNFDRHTGHEPVSESTPNCKLCFRES